MLSPLVERRLAALRTTRVIRESIDERDWIDRCLRAIAHRGNGTGRPRSSPDLFRPSTQAGFGGWTPLTVRCETKGRASKAFRDFDGVDGCRSARDASSAFPDYRSVVWFHAHGHDAGCCESLRVHSVGQRHCACPPGERSQGDGGPEVPSQFLTDPARKQDAVRTMRIRSEPPELCVRRMYNPCGRSKCSARPEK